MDYYVIGADGNKYGPVDKPTLQQWAAEGRVMPHSEVHDVATGVQGPAGQIPGVFGVAPAQPPPAQSPNPGTPYAQPTYQAYPRQNASYPSQESSGPLWGIIIRCALAFVSFFVLGGFGFIFGGYALYYAVQLKSAGSKYGTLALVIAGITMAIILGGWVLRLGAIGA
jgi:hypothetical protein